MRVVQTSRNQHKLENKPAATSSLTTKPKFPGSIPRPEGKSRDGSCGPLDVDRDGDYSDRTIPVHLWSTPWAGFRSVTIGTGTYGAPTGRLTGQFKPEIPGSRA
jgi:hypothetical protein